ncbi:MAG: hypothetical protein M1838_002610 [Thelocarpon superellum]|nr:MAG: hypothetical protein M1838_002610 [Thelocarpon superellum]
MSANDTATLQLALYLEHLEYALYSQGYSNYSEAAFEAAGFPSGFRDSVNVIAQQELIHATTITQVLEENGVTPVPPCTYKFPSTDPVSFVDLSNMVTTVGIGAYIGGSTFVSDNPTLLTTAASILTNEARHDAFLRAGVQLDPFPTAFDQFLTAVWAYNLAQAFIVSCPQPLPIIVLPTLTLTSPTPAPKNTSAPAGTPLEFAWDPSKYFVPVSPDEPLYIALVNNNSAPIFQEVQSTGSGSGSVPLPANVTGVAFAVLTTFAGGLDVNALTSYGTLAGPAEVVIT